MKNNAPNSCPKFIPKNPVNTAPAPKIMLNTANRFTGPEALTAGISDEILTEEELLAATIAHSTVLATKSREVIGIHKQMLYGDTIRALTGA